MVEEEKNNIFVGIAVNNINLVKSWVISKLKQGSLFHIPTQLSYV